MADTDFERNLGPGLSAVFQQQALRREYVERHLSPFPQQTIFPDFQWPPPLPVIRKYSFAAFLESGVSGEGYFERPPGPALGHKDFGVDYFYNHPAKHLMGRGFPQDKRSSSHVEISAHTQPSKKGQRASVSVCCNQNCGAPLSKGYRFEDEEEIFCAACADYFQTHGAHCEYNTISLKRYAVEMDTDNRICSRCEVVETPRWKYFNAQLVCEKCLFKIQSEGADSNQLTTEMVLNQGFDKRRRRDSKRPSYFNDEEGTVDRPTVKRRASTHEYSSDLSGAVIPKRERKRNSFAHIYSDPLKCSNPNCATTEHGTVWRYYPGDDFREHPYCNACCLYLTTRGIHRSVEMCQRPKKKQLLRQIPAENRICSECQTNQTSLWRFAGDHLMCNSCAQKWKKHNESGAPKGDFKPCVSRTKGKRRPSLKNSEDFLFTLKEVEVPLVAPASSAPSSLPVSETSSPFITTAPAMAFSSSPAKSEPHLNAILNPVIPES